MFHLPHKPHSAPDSPAIAIFVTAIGHIHIGLPEPRPDYPLHEADYLEAAEMSRLMERL